ncbi:MAG TPA: hypothetical protein VNA15_05325, partial [Candidatus Angelobacter sp.]|nr:hypothetical protein [Candidatus Angelobacter sp.]
MLDIKSRKTIALLTTAVLLMVLSLAMPTAYADTLLDPRVVGSGSGLYSRGAVVCDSPVTIAFSGSGSTNGGHGTWSFAQAPP